ncbi:cell division protein FtsQ/DivIB [Lichenicola sp.]|uniref:cell division protein FtsQ/DivIB n=1 Tax=Lichenicola sp. TaxID=2804529 RepID=UPI003B0006E9
MPRVRATPTQAGGLMDRPSRFGIFARRQRRLVRPVFFAALLVGVAGGGLHLAHLMRNEATFAPLRAEFGQKAALRIATITVIGRDMTPEPQLMQALGAKVGDDILGFSVEEARKRIDTLSFVEHATVERRLPGTLVVQLTERRPFAVWQNQGRFVLIDRKGQVVADQGMNGKDAEAFAELPLVVGVGAPAAAEALINALDSEPLVHAHVVAAVRVGQRRWNLTLRNGCDVLLPEGEEPAALHRLAQLQASQQLLVRPLLAIDMRLSDRLVVRPRPAPAPEPGDAATGGTNPDDTPGVPGAPAAKPIPDNRGTGQVGNQVTGQAGGQLQPDGTRTDTARRPA